MPRSRINGNFIDKTFTIVADILYESFRQLPEKKRHLLITEMVRFDYHFFFSADF